MTEFTISGRPAEGPGLVVAGAGDVNGDGLDDIVIGHPYANRGSRKGVGEAFIVFGSLGPCRSAVDLRRLAPTAGVRIDGAFAGDETGYAVAGAGDVNGDGFDDVLIGTHPEGATNRSGISDEDAGLSAAPDPEPAPGAVYVVYGRPNFPSVVNLAKLDGKGNFRIDGLGDPVGTGVAVAAAGDVNADGFDDILIGTPWAENGAGAVHVVFGARDRGAVVVLSRLDGRVGFRIDGVASGDHAGLAIAGGSDVNGDGVDDLAIGAPDADAPDAKRAGAAYVVFGRRGGGFPPRIALADLEADRGFAVLGAAALDGAGSSVALPGDLNDDGRGELVVGAPWNSGAGRTQAGAAHVISFSTVVGGTAVKLGSNGGSLHGAKPEDWAGSTVAPAGDVDGDGRADLLIGSPLADPTGRNAAGMGHVVFGASALPSAARTLGREDFEIFGTKVDGRTGRSLAGVGDVDGDGRPDVAVGGRSVLLLSGVEIARGGSTSVTTARAGATTLSGGDGPGGFTSRATVQVTVVGEGRVTSPSIAIVCPPTCNAAADLGASAELVANPAPGWRFAGWSGACSGFNACTVGDDSSTVAATFVTETAGAARFLDADRAARPVDFIRTFVEVSRTAPPIRAVGADGQSELVLVYEAAGSARIRLKAANATIARLGSERFVRNLSFSASDLLRVADRRLAVVRVRLAGPEGSRLTVSVVEGEGEPVRASLPIVAPPVVLVPVPGSEGSAGDLVRSLKTRTPWMFVSRNAEGADAAEIAATLQIVGASAISTARLGGVVSGLVDVVDLLPTSPEPKNLVRRAVRLTGHEPALDLAQGVAVEARIALADIGVWNGGDLPASDRFAALVGCWFSSASVCLAPGQAGDPEPDRSTQRISEDRLLADAQLRVLRLGERDARYRLRPVVIGGRIRLGPVHPFAPSGDPDVAMWEPAPGDVEYRLISGDRAVSVHPDGTVIARATGHAAIQVSAAGLTAEIPVVVILDQRAAR